MDVLQMFADTDAMGRGVALLLLAMSVATWVVALYKGWLLHRAARAGIAQPPRLPSAHPPPSRKMPQRGELTLNDCVLYGCVSEIKLPN